MPDTKLPNGYSDENALDEFCKVIKSSGVEAVGYPVMNVPSVCRFNVMKVSDFMDEFIKSMNMLLDYIR